MAEMQIDGECYDLFFNSLKIGVVTQTDSDFPNLWGNVAYEPWVSSPKSAGEQQFSRFIALNKESIRLLDMEDQVDTSDQQAAVNAELELEFMGYVESEQWRLVDRGGHDLRILCPIFRGDDEMVWRWNPGRK